MRHGLRSKWRRQGVLVCLGENGSVCGVHWNRYLSRSVDDGDDDDVDGDDVDDDDYDAAPAPAPAPAADH